MEKITIHETEREAKYWTQFYEKIDFESGSSFFELVNSLPELPDTIIDIGCGQGRDSFAFAEKGGRQVIGLDRSGIGIESANEKVRTADRDLNLSFYECDVSNTKDLLEVFDYARSQHGSENVCYYMRFFLHSIPEDTQNGLMKAIAQHARPGDVFAAEFRTDEDECKAKEFGSTHYRRYQNSGDFSEALKEEYGWSGVVHEIESDGLSPYGDEDPVLYRVVAVR